MEQIKEYRIKGQRVDVPRINFTLRKEEVPYVVNYSVLANEVACTVKHRSEVNLNKNNMVENKTESGRLDVGWCPVLVLLVTVLLLWLAFITVMALVAMCVTKITTRTLYLMSVISYWLQKLWSQRLRGTNAHIRLTEYDCPVVNIETQVLNDLMADETFIKAPNIPEVCISELDSKTCSTYLRLGNRVIVEGTLTPSLSNSLENCCSSLPVNGEVQSTNSEEIMEYRVEGRIPKVEWFEGIVMDKMKLGEDEHEKPRGPTLNKLHLARPPEIK